MSSTSSPTSSPSSPYTTVPVQVREIRVQGNVRHTNSTFLTTQIRGAGNGDTIQEVAGSLQRCHQRLQSLDIFKSVAFEMIGSPKSSHRPLSSSSSSSSNGSSSISSSSGTGGGDRELIDIVIDLEEKRQWAARGFFQREVMTAENSLSLQGKWRNLTGRGDTIQASGTIGDKLSQQYDLEYSLPCVWGGQTPTRLSAAIYSRYTNYSIFSSMRDRCTGARVSLSDIGDGWLRRRLFGGGGSTTTTPATTPTTVEDDDNVMWLERIMYPGRHRIDFTTALRDILPCRDSRWYLQQHYHRSSSSSSSNGNGAGNGNGDDTDTAAAALDGVNVLPPHEPSPTILAACRPSVKTAITHTYAWRDVDDDAIPHCGHSYQIQTEMAGGIGTLALPPLGDVHHLKCDVSAAWHLPLPFPRQWRTTWHSWGEESVTGDGGDVASSSSSSLATGSTVAGGDVVVPQSPLALSVTCRGGMMHSFSSTAPSLPTSSTSSTSSTSHPIDRFFIGGPQSIRGYHHSTVGPRDGDDALGGEVYACGGISLLARWPGWLGSNYGFHTHCFVNAGNAMLWDRSSSPSPSSPSPSSTSPSPSSSPSSSVRSVSEQLSDTLVGGMRCSIGVGVMMPTPFGRVEVLLASPYRHQSQDFIQRFQIGIGFDLMDLPM